MRDLTKHRFDPGPFNLECEDARQLSPEQAIQPDAETIVVWAYFVRLAVGRLW